MPRRSVLASLCLLVFPVSDLRAGDDPADGVEPSVHDVIVYGGTGSAVIAAVQARRMGKSVVIVCPDRHLGGLSSGGLGFADTGDKSAIGGLAREFYHRIWKQCQILLVPVCVSSSHIAFGSIRMKPVFMILG